MEEPFFQEAPSLGNQYDDDPVLRSFLQRVLPPDVLWEIEPDLRRMGERAATDILELARQAEAQPPRHIPFDPWGRRIDRIEVSQAWRDLDRISAEEGLVAIAYERQYGPWSRLYQFAKLYLFHPSSALYSCPLAMTDGAARVVELYGDEGLKAGALRRLTSRDPAFFWTSGQWMTERGGGSDVGVTTTEARVEDGGWRLYGDKWFTSAVTAQMAMTLARPQGAPAGSRGLGLFYLELGNPEGGLNRIRVNRLKDKLGTRALPTAELSLEGSWARPLGGLGDGVKKIASLFNITRLHNSVDAAAFMRRGLALARDYARKRRAFGRLLSETPLYLETLSGLEVEFRAAFALAFRAAEVLGRVETGKGGGDEAKLLRILTPLAKLFTGKRGVQVVGEVAECFGGAGYVEDTGIPGLLRDAHVLPIWEGTTDVLSMDVLRAIQKENALGPFWADVQARLAAVTAAPLKDAAKGLWEAGSRLVAQGEREGFPEARMREVSFSMARLYGAGLLLEQAQWDLTNGKGRLSTAAALRWRSQGFGEPGPAGPAYLADSKGLALSEE